VKALKPSLCLRVCAKAMPEGPAPTIMTSGLRMFTSYLNASLTVERGGILQENCESWSLEKGLLLLEKYFAIQPAYEAAACEFAISPFRVLTSPGFEFRGK
jgi:hypothetical protein